MSDLRTGTAAGWEKYAQSPVIGGDLGTCFDVSVLYHDDLYKMYFSWRPEKCIAYCESADGISWSAPIKCIKPRPSEKGWEDDLNRPAVLLRDGLYHMWYTGQYLAGEANGTSHIFYATSSNGVDFKRFQDTPVLYPCEEWEKSALMCPNVIWDDDAQMYRMWYSGGEQYEPNAIGYAFSRDGINWTKNSSNPIFSSDKSTAWEQHKVAACHVTKTDDRYLMFYVGFYNEDYAQIGIARSADGISKWQRHPLNPIIAPSPGNWDAEACYKPYTIFDGKKWILWYNGRVGHFEQIGVAFHDGLDLSFDV